MDKNLPETMKGDSLRLQQIILNLLNNAIKFTDNGKVTLEVRRHHSMASGDHLLFRVIDTGHGLAKDVLPRLFQDFTQATKSVARTYGGTGLGLSICRKLIALMGGEIGAQSAIGKGSTFWFIIPIERSGSDKLKSPPINQENELKSFNVLITEDNPINQQVLTELLSSLHQKFTIANDGVEAINVIKENEFDLVFMDMNMPILDGFSATQEIRKLEKGKEIPIIILTADTYSIDKKEFLANGVTQIIHKPLTRDKLSDIIKFYQEDKSAKENYIDLPQITLLCDDIGVEIVLRLLDAYVTDGRRIINQLKTEKSGDFYNLAHTLAGMSENLGMKVVAELAQNLMIILQSKKGNPSPIINQLIKNFNKTVSEIDNVKKKIML
ncbi:ATP-binding protein [Candidatus Paracaedibacter symbiosus]|uniref:ATP-binding protein n=1 Tax=Candidatus Paracaedibacter symbiosus TaxID=244582 RepID=UPI000509F759|nr:ATP-binding protein [Candidatus Paracaedibacter symbiosus]